MEHQPTLDSFNAWLSRTDQAWVGGFDLPFGLPRGLVQTLGWPTDWAACMDQMRVLAQTHGAKGQTRYHTFTHHLQRRLGHHNHPIDPGL